MSRPYQENLNFIEKKGHQENDMSQPIIEIKGNQGNTVFEKQVNQDQDQENGSTPFLKRKKNILILILSVILLLSITFVFILNKSGSRQAISSQKRRSKSKMNSSALNQPYPSLESGYRVIISDKGLENISTYKTKLESNISLAGNRLRESLGIMNVDNGQQVKQMSVNNFVDALLGSKLPKVFAEEEIYSPTFRWSSEDARVLGDINIVMPVKIFDDGKWASPKIHDNCFDGYLMFTPGALLVQHCDVDYEEVTSNGSLNENAYFELYERRLLPLFRFANDESKAKNINAVVTIPGIGCGQFAGTYNGSKESLIDDFDQVLKRLLEKYADQLPNISLVYFGQFSILDFCEKNDIGHIKYRRVSSASNNYKNLLDEPTSYSIDGENYTNHLLFAFVAWDHVSYPGNDFFAMERATDDGVKAAATSSMTSLLGVDGTYDKSDYKYKPAGSYNQFNWLEIALKQELNSQDRLFILSTDEGEIKLEQMK